MEASHINKSSWEIFVKTKKGDGVEKVGLNVSNLDLTLIRHLNCMGLEYSQQTWYVTKSRTQH